MITLITHSNKPHTLESTLPKISAEGIYLPLNVVRKDAGEKDGRANGHPYDSGAYWSIEYELAVGALADDTLAMYLRSQEQIKQLGFDLRELTKFREIPDWNKGLSRIPQGLHWDSWPDEHRQRYQEVHYLTKEQKKAAKVLLENTLALYPNPNQTLYEYEGQLYASYGAFVSGGAAMSVKLAPGCTLKSIQGFYQSQQKIDQSAAETLVEVGHNLVILKKKFGFRGENAAKAK